MSLKRRSPGEEGQAYVIRPLGFTHLRQVARLERLLFPEPLSPGTLLRLWMRRDTRYLGVLKGPAVVAYIGFQVWGPIAHTISMGVHPAHRRRGLATCLQAAADRLAAQMGARWFMGEVRRSNTPQLALLRKLGWQPLGLCRGFFRNGEDAVVMWHLLRLEDGAIPSGIIPPCSAPGAEEPGGEARPVVHPEGAEEQ